MSHRISLACTPGEPIVIVHAEPQQLTDEVVARRLRCRLSRHLGELPVILRCRLGETVLLSGPEHHHRHAIGPEIDALPIISIELPDERREAA